MAPADTPDVHPSGHTSRDADALQKLGIDPELCQPRERSVPCRFCATPTWHRMACCDDHYQPPGAAAAETCWVRFEDLRPGDRCGVAGVTITGEPYQDLDDCSWWVAAQDDGGGAHFVQGPDEPGAEVEVTRPVVAAA